MAVEDSVAADQLIAIIERVERLESEKDALTEDVKQVYSQAKGEGFDTKIIRKIVAIRKQDAHERMEEAALMELYMVSIGMVEGIE